MDTPTPFVGIDRHTSMQEDVSMGDAAQRTTIPLFETQTNLGFSIRGRRYCLCIWTDEQWDRLVGSEIPRDAKRLGAIGWVAIRRDRN
jgi:hypothetical protein